MNLILLSSSLIAIWQLRGVIHSYPTPLTSYKILQVFRYWKMELHSKAFFALSCLLEILLLLSEVRGRLYMLIGVPLCTLELHSDFHLMPV